MRSEFFFSIQDNMVYIGHNNGFKTLLLKPIVDIEAPVQQAINYSPKRIIFAQFLIL